MMGDIDGTSFTQGPIHEVVECMHLPCGHLADAPNKLATTKIVCEFDNRRWSVTYKNGEYLAREEF